MKRLNAARDALLGRGDPAATSDWPSDDSDADDSGDARGNRARRRRKRADSDDEAWTPENSSPRKSPKKKELDPSPDLAPRTRVGRRRATRARVAADDPRSRLRRRGRSAPACGMPPRARG